MSPNTPPPRRPKSDGGQAGGSGRQAAGGSVAGGQPPYSGAPPTGGERSRIPGGIPDGAIGADREFYVLADRYLDELFADHPSAATAVGLHVHDLRLDDWSAPAVAERKRHARRWRDRFACVDTARLSAGARIDHRLVETDAEGTIFSLEDLKPHEHDPQFYVDLLGNALLYLTLLDGDSPHWPERLEALASRLAAVPDFLAAARAAIDAPPRVTTEMVLKTHAGNVRFIENNLPPLFERAPKALRTALDGARAAALEAARSFEKWVETDLMPRATGDWRLGRDLWTRKLRFALQSDMEPEEIATRARAAIDETRERMMALAEPLHARLHPGHRHTEQGDALVNAIVGEVVDHASQRRPTRETLFGTVRTALDRITAFLRAHPLVTLPPEDDNFVLEPTPGFLDGMAVAFFNPPPTLEPDLKKSFWISSLPKGATPEEDRALEASFLREYNDHALQGLSIHEAFPGHYVQYWHALRSPMASVYKKVFSSGTFAEGWAVLAEKMVFDAGYADAEPECVLIHLKHALRAPINALLDARLHTGGEPDAEIDRWTLDILTRTGFQEEAEARGKLRRAKVTSTQLSTYFVGFLEMHDILEDARRAAGPDFDLKAHNDRVLSFGTIPPRDARELLGLPPRRRS